MLEFPEGTLIAMSGAVASLVLVTVLLNMVLRYRKNRNMDIVSVNNWSLFLCVLLVLAQIAAAVVAIGTDTKSELTIYGMAILCSMGLAALAAAGLKLVRLVVVWGTLMLSLAVAIYVNS